MLCQLADSAPWSPEDKQDAKEALSKFREAANLCEDQLRDVLLARKRMKLNKLPLWCELGDEAEELMQVTNAAPNHCRSTIDPMVSGAQHEHGSFHN